MLKLQKIYSVVGWGLVVLCLCIPETGWTDEEASHLSKAFLERQWKSQPKGQQMKDSSAIDNRFKFLNARFKELVTDDKNGISRQDLNKAEKAIKEGKSEAIPKRVRQAMDKYWDIIRKDNNINNSAANKKWFERALIDELSGYLVVFDRSGEEQDKDEDKGPQGKQPTGKEEQGDKQQVKDADKERQTGERGVRTADQKKKEEEEKAEREKKIDDELKRLGGIKEALEQGKRDREKALADARDRVRQGLADAARARGEAQRGDPSGQGKEKGNGKGSGKAGGSGGGQGSAKGGGGAGKGGPGGGKGGGGPKLGKHNNDGLRKAANNNASSDSSPRSRGANRGRNGSNARQKPTSASSPAAKASNSSAKKNVDKLLADSDDDSDSDLDSSDFDGSDDFLGGETNPVSQNQFGASPQPQGEFKTLGQIQKPTSAAAGAATGGGNTSSANAALPKLGGSNNSNSVGSPAFDLNSIGANLASMGAAGGAGGASYTYGRPVGQGSSSVVGLNLGNGIDIGEGPSEAEESTKGEGSTGLNSPYANSAPGGLVDSIVKGKGIKEVSLSSTQVVVEGHREGIFKVLDEKVFDKDPTKVCRLRKVGGELVDVGICEVIPQVVREQFSVGKLGADI